MAFNYDCKHINIDEDSAHCSVCGWIYDCPTGCEEYVNHFGKQPYKEDIEAKLRGEQ